MKGEAYLFRGRVTRQGEPFSLANPTFVSPDTAEEQAPLLPIYHLTAGLTQNILRSLVEQVLPTVVTALEDMIPHWMRRTYELCTLAYALENIHQPQHQMALHVARRRLAFEELLLIQAGLRLNKMQREADQQAITLPKTTAVCRALDDLETGLPFSLTSAQKQAIADIHDDLSKERPMNRLVQGDVGSGKTVVAAFAMAHAACSGAQAVMMAPTSILAQQHWGTLNELLAPLNLSVALLTGQTKVAERRKLLESLANGDQALLVGTHAVLEQDISFKKLALIVTDEQHRFGVRQRGGLLRGDGDTPHALVMSATPIPRTLALILYGDLDISVMRELPPGRKPVKTYTARSKDRQRVDALMRRTVDAGEQVYVVCPIIEDSDVLDVDSATSTYNRLAQEVFPDHTVGLLHGGLKDAAKDRKAFLDGQVSVLIATTIVEVGVDNPNATMMVIEMRNDSDLRSSPAPRPNWARSGVTLRPDQRFDDRTARDRLKTLCSRRMALSWRSKIFVCASVSSSAQSSTACHLKLVNL